MDAAIGVFGLVAAENGAGFTGPMAGLVAPHHGLSRDIEGLGVAAVLEIAHRQDTALVTPSHVGAGAVGSVGFGGLRIAVDESGPFFAGPFEPLGVHRHNLVRPALCHDRLEPLGAHDGPQPATTEEAVSRGDIGQGHPPLAGRPDHQGTGSFTAAEMLLAGVRVGAPEFVARLEGHALGRDSQDGGAWAAPLNQEPVVSGGLEGHPEGSPTHRGDHDAGEG
jgi:hypothetical protein